MRPCGYRRNASRKPIKAFASHPAASALPSGGANLSAFAPRIFDQGQTGSCVPHARIRGIYIAIWYALQKPLAFMPSPDGLYKVVHMLEVGDPSAPLQDNGCDPVDSIDAVQSVGVRTMGPMAKDGRYSDVDPDTINERVKFAELIKDSEARFTEDHEITETGETRTALICAALDAGYPVDIDVSGGGGAFQSYSGGVLHTDGTPLDHYVCLVGYSTDATGNVLYLGHNSWGESWGNSGTFEAGEDVIQAARDIIVNVAKAAT